MSIRYLSTLRFEDDWLAELRRRVPGVEITQIPAACVADVPAEVWRNTDVVHTSTVLPDPQACPRLKWVQLDTSGVDHLHGTVLWDSQVAITTIGGVSPVPLAEYVMFAILGAAHRLPELLDTQRSRRWPTPEQRWETMLPSPVRGATLGILGYGRIGREVGRLARAHGMTVVAVSRTGRRADPADTAQVNFAQPPDDADVQLVASDRLLEVLARSDYLAVILPLTERTRGLLDAEALGHLKQGAVVINAARGGIVDEAALRAALRRGAVSCAILDVFDDEPLLPDSPWWTEPNVFLTPHVAGLAPRYADQVLDIVAENLARFAAGGPLINLVDRAWGY